MSAPFQPTTDDAAFAAYLDRLAAAMQHQSRHQPLRDYCTGLLLPDGRKSVEPMAARLAPATARTKHKTLLNFVSEGTWSDTAVLTAMREAVLPAIEAHGPVRFWITDETSMAKKGMHSVGVARQY
jgi:SRSO17 transposase